MCKQSRKISTTKIGEHIPCGYAMSSIWAFYNIEMKQTLCQGKDCMKKFCTSLREHVTNLIDFEKKKMLPLTKKEPKLYQYATACYICGKRFLKEFADDKKYQTVRYYCHFTGKYRGAALGISSLRLNAPKEILVVFHNGSNYDYHFIMKKLGSKFKVQFKSLKKYRKAQNIFRSNKKITKIDKNGHKSVATISYKIIDNTRFMASLWLNLVDDIAQGIQKIKCKYCNSFLE